MQYTCISPLTLLVFGMAVTASYARVMTHILNVNNIGFVMAKNPPGLPGGFLWNTVQPIPHITVDGIFLYKYFSAGIG